MAAKIKINVSFMLICLLTISSIMLVPFANAKAATVALSTNEVVLNIGEKFALNLDGTNKKPTYSSEKKEVATITSGGKITAKDVGYSVITAQLKDKKYYCMVIVKEKNPAIANASFSAKESIFNYLSFVHPKKWTFDTKTKKDSILIYPSSADIKKGTSNITLKVHTTNKKAPSYSTVKKELVGKLEDNFRSAGLDISNFKTSDYKTKLGTALCASFNQTTKGKTLKNRLYILYLDNYLIQLTITDNGKKTSPDVTEVGKYMLNSIQKVW